MYNHAIRTMIITLSTSESVKLASKLKDFGISACTRSADEKTIIRNIISEKPDTVIIDLTLNGTDAAAIMEKVSALTPVPPAFIVLSDIRNSFIEKQLLALGAYLVFVKPIDNIEELADAVAASAIKSSAPISNDPEYLVTELLHNAGIPPHIKGYRYIRTSLLECLRDRSLIDSITKNLYTRVAEKYKTTPSSIERAIRHALKSTWERGNKRKLYSSLGYSPDLFYSYPTNSEFLAMSVDYLSLKIKTTPSFHVKPIMKITAGSEMGAF